MANPLCTYFGECGGCSWQHLDYPIQTENKKKTLANAINFNDIKIFAGKEYFYRNRMDMVFHEKGIGLREKRKWDRIINIEKCAISNEKLNNLIKEVGDFFNNVDAFDLKKHIGAFRYAVIRTPPEDSSISFVLNGDSTKLKEAVEKITEFSAVTTSDNIIIVYTPQEADFSTSDEFFAVKGSEMLKERYLGNEFLYPAQGFFQNNHEVAEKMQEYCHGLLKPYGAKEAHLIDLYGGGGAFGVINASLFKEVTIIESDKLAVKAANINIKNNKADNARAIELDAKNLKKIGFPKPLFVIADPPRSGMHPKAIEQLKNLRPEAIIYISCNAEQLGKDILKFKDYRIKSAALFDLFPQTTHIEAVAELTLNKG